MIKGFVYTIALCIGLSTGAQAANFEFGTGVKSPDGEISYDIGISKLQFNIAPKQSQFYNMTLPVGNMELRTEFEKNESFLQEDSFLDTDYNSDKSIAIQSQADTTLAYETAKAQLVMPLISNADFSLNVGAGYHKETFDYTVSNGVQTNYNTQTQVTYGENALTYHYESSIPHLLLEMEYQVGIFRPFLSLAASPIAEVTAVDDHVLRKKVAKFKSSGNWFDGTVGMMMNIMPNMELKLAYQFQSLSTTGEHTQTRYEATSEGDVGHIWTAAHITEQKSQSAIANLSITF